MPKSFNRVDRIRHQLMRDVAETLRREIKGYDLTSVTITQTEVSRDLKFAKVFYTLMGEQLTREDAERILTKVRPVVQSIVGHKLGIRIVPELQFEYDDAVERSLRLGQLFTEIEEERDNDETDNQEN